jgi:hypothetical protein
MANDADGMLDLFLRAADELVALGVDGITTSCGFLAILPKGKRVGVLTADKVAQRESRRRSGRWQSASPAPTTCIRSSRCRAPWACRANPIGAGAIFWTAEPTTTTGHAGRNMDAAGAAADGCETREHPGERRSLIRRLGALIRGCHKLPGMTRHRLTAPCGRSFVNAMTGS